MPHIRLRALNESVVQKLSRELPKELAPLMQTSIENFTIENVATVFYQDGKQIEGDPMIEVLWFDRGQEVKNNCAKKITELVQESVKALFIAVVFVPLSKENYFENGQHF